MSQTKDYEATDWKSVRFLLFRLCPPSRHCLPSNITALFCREFCSADGQLLLHVFVTVQAELGVVGEVGAEFQEEGTKVSIHAVNVKVVDQDRC